MCRTLACFLFGLSACQQTPSGPIRVAILGTDPASGEYLLLAASVDTLGSLTRLEGEAATLVRGAKIVIDPVKLAAAEAAGKLQTLDDVRDAITRRRGRAPRAAFSSGTLDGEPGVWIADDFESLAMVTAYHHLEKARHRALEQGMPARCLIGITTYYDLDFREQFAGQGVALTDNAAYFPLLDSFLILPFEFYPTVPLAMNGGVMAHEYSHGVWGCIIEDSAPIARLEFSVGEKGARQLIALNEGLADQFGAQVTGDPNFISGSIPEASLARNLSTSRLYTTEMDESALTGDDFDPYALGAVLASALWSIREDALDPRSVGAVVIRSLERLRARLEALVAAGQAFDIDIYLEELVGAFDDIAPAERDQACSKLQTRFRILGGIGGCP